MAVLQQELSLGEAAAQLARALPGHRVEIATPRQCVGVDLELSVDVLLDGDG